MCSKFDRLLLLPLFKQGTDRPVGLPVRIEPYTTRFVTHIKHPHSYDGITYLSRWEGFCYSVQDFILFYAQVKCYGFATEIEPNRVLAVDARTPSAPIENELSFMVILGSCRLSTNTLIAEPTAVILR